MTKKKIPAQPASLDKTAPLIFNFSLRIKIALLFLVSFCFYANSLSNQYALDDEAVIQTNEYVQKGFAGIGKILTTDAYDCYSRINKSNQHLSGGRYRPLSIVLFALEHQLWGEAPNKRHLVNVLLYALCVLAIFYFLKTYLFSPFPYGEDIAFIATLLFAMHPLHTEVVANIKSSDEILSLIFIMLCFIFSIKYKETNNKGHLAIALISIFLALLAKEYALTLLFLLPFLFVLYFNEKPGKAIQSSLPYYGVIALYMLIRFKSIGFAHQHNELDILNNPYLYATPMQKLASEIFILGKYLWMLFVPFPLSYDYGFAQIPYHSFSSPLVWLTIIAYAAIIYWGIVLLRKKNILAFPLFFFLLNLFMVSNLFLNIGATMGERLIFHSSFGFVTIISFGIINGIKNLDIPQKRMVIITLAAGLTILCGMETVGRNRDWKDNFTLFTKDVNTISNSVKANDNAGAQYVNLSETITDTLKSDSIARIGIKYLYKAIQLDDSDIDSHLNLGIGYCKLIQPDSAKHHWDIVKRLYSNESHLPSYYLLLGKIFLYTGNQFAKKGKFQQSIHEIEMGIKCDPNNPELWFNLGGTFFNMAKYDSARYAWFKTGQIEPNYPMLSRWLQTLPPDSGKIEK